MKKGSSKNQSTLLQSWGVPSNSNSSGIGEEGSWPPPKLKAVVSCNKKKQKVQKEADFDLDGAFDDDVDINDEELVSGIESIPPGITSSNDTETFLDDKFIPDEEHETIKGFDVHFGSTYIYPTNYPVREYQFDIVKSALLNNALVVLPTGLGKTFIAAVVMYNFYRWYPQGKLIFMAPTKPLVAQQMEACYNIMGIPQADTAEMTGTKTPQKRELLWKSKRVFFLTPQVLQNDIGRGTCFAPDVACLVFDEAHRALGNHAYCQVVREVARYHQNFRVLALSATPGDDMRAVQQVIENLLISHIEIRMEESPDIQKYSFHRKLQKIVVPLSKEMKEIQSVHLQVMQQVIDRLYLKKAVWQNNAQQLSKFALLQAREQWRNNNSNGCKDRNAAGVIEGEFATAVSLYHANDVLHQHGLLSFYNFLKGILAGTKGSGGTRMELSRNTNFMQMMENLFDQIEPNEMNISLNESIMHGKNPDPKKRLLKSIPKPLKNFASHPKLKKLEELVLDHFRKYDGNDSNSENKVKSRIIIFSQYRDSVQEITAVLTKHEPMVKVMSFIGQGSKESAGGKRSRGLSQKEQLEVIQKFRNGGYNTIVSTSVGEEGLDIGQVDLIVCFDAPSSPIRLIQRMGRTGRKREGHIVMLVTEGKEEAAYKKSLNSKKGIHKNLLNAAQRFEFYQESQRMIPRHMNPRCYKMCITVDKYEKENSRRSLSKSDDGKMPRRKSSKGFSDSNQIKKNIYFNKGPYLDKNENLFLENEYFGDIEGCSKCEYNRSLKLPIKFCSHLDIRYPLSLTKFCPWQTSTQSYSTIGHSIRTLKFCKAMSFMDCIKDDLEAEKYEKRMQDNFDKGDLMNTSRENSRRNSSSSKKPKKGDLGKAWRKNYVDNLNAVDSEDDDFSNFDVLKKANEVKKIFLTSDDDDLKPCSLDKLLEKVESDKKIKKNKVRLTKLPKIPTKEVEIATIEDNQLDFCSQVSMDTLYNRIRKKSNPSLKTFHDEIKENRIEEKDEENEEKDPVLDWIRNIQEPNEKDETNKKTSPPITKLTKKSTVIGEDDDDILFGNSSKLGIEDEYDKDDDEVLGFLPSSPTKTEKNISKSIEKPYASASTNSTKPKNVCVVKPTIRSHEAPSDIDSDFLEPTQQPKVKKKVLSRNCNKEIIPEPPSDILDDHIFEIPALPMNLKKKKSPNKSITKTVSNATNRDEIFSKKTSSDIVPLPPMDACDDFFNFDDEPEKKPRLSKEKSLFSEKSDKETKDLDTSITGEKMPWDDDLFDVDLNFLDDISDSPPMISQRNYSQSDSNLNTVTNISILQQKECVNSPLNKEIKLTDVETPTQIVRKVKSRSSNRLDKFNFVNEDECLDEEDVAKIIPKPNKLDLSVNKKDTDKVSSSDEEDSPLVNKKKAKKNCITYTQQSPDVVESHSSEEEDSPLVRKKVVKKRFLFTQGTPNSKRNSILDDESPIVKKKTSKKAIFETEVTPNGKKRLSNQQNDNQSSGDEFSDSYFVEGKVSCKRPKVKHSSDKVACKRRRNMFIEDEAEDDGEEDSFIEENERNEYIKDSFIDDNTQFSQTISSETSFMQHGKTPIDMNIIYKQSLMSPANCPLKFRTPAFKAGRSRFKMVDMKENMKNRNLDESSEAEEVMGLVQSDEEFVCSEPEDSKYADSPYDRIQERVVNRKHGKKKLFRTSAVENDDTYDQEDDFIDDSSFVKVQEQPEKKISGRRVMIQDSDDDKDNDDKTEKQKIGNESKKKIAEQSSENADKKKTWCKTYSVYNLPEITFSFCIEWPSIADSPPPKKKEKNKNKKDNSTNLTEKVKEVSSSGNQPAVDSNIKSSIPLVLIDSRCVSNSKIATTLRLKEDCKVLVHEKLHCDYIISKRSGLLRKNLCDVTNGGNFLKLSETLRPLFEVFSKVYVIIEKDRVNSKSSKRPREKMKQVDCKTYNFHRQFDYLD